MKLGVLSVVPSPYQRDLFRALADMEEIELEVAYLEAAAPDSPWPVEMLAPFESILPGRTVGEGRVRCHANSKLPDPDRFDAYIVNTALTALTTQRMFRRLHRHPDWFFWGEILRRNRGLKSLVQNRLAKPLGSANAIVAIGSKARADYQSRFPAARVEQLPYFCDLSKFGVKRTVNPSPVFLFCGQMIERKGIDLLLAAFRRIREEGIAAKLLLAGRETDLVDHPLHPDIELVGFQAPEDLPKLFARADAFVLPSRHDGWGVVINQAIGASLPIISTSAVGAACDLVKDGINGVIVPPGELEPLIDAMRRLAIDSALRQTMSEAASSLAQDLSPESGARRWLEILQTDPCASS
jgi:glycosyltransferase involved in cell wall biosynthesis